MKKFIFILLWLPMVANALPATDRPEVMTPTRFQEITGTPCDATPLVPQLASVPFFTNAIASSVMTYASGKVFQEEIPVTGCTVAGKYIVFTFQSKLYNQTMHSILTYDTKVGALKSYGLYGGEHGQNRVVEATVVYNYAQKTYTMTASYDDFKETTTGSYTDTDDAAQTMIYKKGELFLTRHVKTHRL